MFSGSESVASLSTCNVSMTILSLILLLGNLINQCDWVGLGRVRRFSRQSTEVKQSKISSRNVCEVFEYLLCSYRITVSMYDRVRPFFVLNLSDNLSLKCRTSNTHHIIPESTMFVRHYEIQTRNMCTQQLLPIFPIYFLRNRVRIIAFQNCQKDKLSLQ